MPSFPPCADCGERFCPNHNHCGKEGRRLEPYAGWDGWKGTWSRLPTGDWGIRITGYAGDVAPKTGERVLVFRKNKTCSIETLGERYDWRGGPRSGTWRFQVEEVYDEGSWEPEYYSDMPH